MMSTLQVHIKKCQQAFIQNGTDGLYLTPLEKVVSLQADLSADEQIICYWILAATIFASHQGHTYIALVKDQTGYTITFDILATLLQDSEQAAYFLKEFILLISQGKLTTLVSTDPHEQKPYIYIEPILAISRFYNLEYQVAIKISELVRKPYIELSDTDVKVGLKAAIATIEQLTQTSPHLSAEQEYAIISSLQSPLTIISGGPGTGKSLLIAAICQALLHLRYPPQEIAVCTPTGRAAQRLNQILPVGHATKSEQKITATTIHKMIGISEFNDTSEYHQNHLLPYSVIIIDESSMIDLELFHHLLQCMKPTTRLIMVGDSQQLPAVSIGAVFHELCKAKPSYLKASPSSSPGHHMSAMSTQLTQSYRVASQHPLYTMLQKILSGEDVIPSDIREFFQEEGLFHVTDAESATQLEEFLKQWYHHYYADSVGVKPTTSEHLISQIARIQHQHKLLCLINQGAFGIMQINQFMHDLHACNYPDLQNQQFLPGEPIIFLKNNYDLHLFNGDIGMVNYTDKPTATFLRGDHCIDISIEDNQRYIQHAYAITVHKAQGSEYDSVALLLPSTYRLLSKELLYTAFTRAKKRFAICGSFIDWYEGFQRSTQHLSGLWSALS